MATVYLDSRKGVKTEGYNQFYINPAVYPIDQNAATITKCSEFLKVLKEHYAKGIFTYYGYPLVNVAWNADEDEIYLSHISNAGVTKLTTITIDNDDVGTIAVTDV